MKSQRKKDERLEDSTVSSQKAQVSLHPVLTSNLN
jgi:hypothetical protein